MWRRLQYGWQKYNLDIEKVRLAALLHDISAIMSPQEMYEIAMERSFEIDPAEESLDEACGFYIKYQFDHNLLLMPHQWIKEVYEELVSDNINKFGRSNINFKILRASDKL